MSRRSDQKYYQRGVSASKEDVHEAIKHSDKGIFPNAFCKITDDIFSNDPNFCNVMHADGAGTKSILAYLYWKETGDLSVWKGIAQDAIVMNLDDLLCVGIYDSILYSSTIGRNKHKIPAVVLKEIIQGTEQIFDELSLLGIRIKSCGGETADIGDLVRTISVDSTVFARWPRSKIIDNSKINDKNVIVGLASFGQSSYEKEYNSGIGSNGITSARHDMLSPFYKTNFPESFDPEIDETLIFNGQFRLTDSVKDLPITIGKALLSPTRTYAPIMKAIFDTFFNRIDGVIHCSGGAQTKCLNFVENLHIIKDNLFQCPPLFRLIQKSSSTDWSEMYKVFNMGHRLEIFTDLQTAEAIINLSEEFGVQAQIIGHCERSITNSQLTIAAEFGQFLYEKNKL